MRGRNIQIILKALASSVVVLIILILVAFRISDNLSKSYDDVERTYQIIRNFEAIESKITKAESAVRAFYISSNPVIEEKINQNLIETRDLLDETRELISSETVLEKFALLSYKVLQKEQNIKDNIAISKQNGALSKEEILLPIQEGIQMIKEIDTLFQVIRKEEGELLAKRKSHSANALRFTMWSLSVVGILSIALGTLAIMSFRKDIRQRKKTEEELRKLDENKNKFFTIISHDLKGPIRGIAALTQMLQESQGVPPEQQRTVLDHLNRSTQNLYRLVENLLDWSRLQMNRMEFSPVSFKFEELAKEAAEQTMLVAEEKNVKLNNQVSTDALVFADKDMLLTVLRNLISNAVKFSNKGSEVDITAKNNKNYLEVNITDYGVGISEDGLTKLFAIGQNYSSEGTSGEQGTGLGLLICKELVEKNNGTINVKSTKGKGTTFTVSIPLV
ncbi:ATP-binding protein [Cytophagaceae bacterium ABcell3]|nr:ATP-binding protein [Cytophagaceae bacterium ABcell3]